MRPSSTTRCGMKTSTAATTAQPRSSCFAIHTKAGTKASV